MVTGVRTSTIGGFYLLGIGESIAQQAPVEVRASALKTETQQKRVDAAEDNKEAAEINAKTATAAVNATLEVEAAIVAQLPNGPEAAALAAQTIVDAKTVDLAEVRNLESVAAAEQKSTIDEAQSELENILVRINIARSDNTNYSAFIPSGATALRSIEVVFSELENFLRRSGNILSITNTDRAAPSVPSQLIKFIEELNRYRVLFVQRTTQVYELLDSGSALTIALKASYDSLSTQLSVTQAKFQVVRNKASELVLLRTRLQTGHAALDAAQQTALGSGAAKVREANAQAQETSRLETQRATISASFEKLSIAQTQKQLSTLSKAEAQSAVQSLQQLQVSASTFIRLLIQAQSASVNAGQTAPSTPIAESNSLLSHAKQAEIFARSFIDASPEEAANALANYDAGLLRVISLLETIVAAATTLVQFYFSGNLQNIGTALSVGEEELRAILLSLKKEHSASEATAFYRSPAPSTPTVSTSAISAKETQFLTVAKNTNQILSDFSVSINLVQSSITRYSARFPSLAATSEFSLLLSEGQQPTKQTFDQIEALLLQITEAAPAARPTLAPQLLSKEAHLTASQVEIESRTADFEAAALTQPYHPAYVSLQRAFLAQRGSILQMRTALKQVYAVVIS